MTTRMSTVSSPLWKANSRFAHIAPQHEPCPVLSIYRIQHDFLQNIISVPRHSQADPKIFYGLLSLHIS